MADPELEKHVVTFRSSADGTEQRTLAFPSANKGPQPLLVALHTWSGDLFQESGNYQRLAKKFGFHLLFPDFRGPNWLPDACGSDKVVADICDCVEWACKYLEVDKKRIYLAGGSGGGHCTLLLAGRRPEIWAGVSAWCPISDLVAWHRQHSGYGAHIEKACGGDPDKSEEAAAQAKYRSPLTWLSGAKGFPVDINTGIHDGHRGSVPVSQSIHAFNLLAKEKDRISDADIDFICKNESLPPSLQGQAQDDSAYGVLQVLFRRVSGNVRLTLFEGGHDAAAGAAVGFLAQQKKGTPADWSLADCDGDVALGVISK